jgi:hypothetical protein
MLAAQSYKPAKTADRDSAGRNKSGKGGEEPVQINPLWNQLAMRVQAKLAISSPDDPYEREADRVADQVLATPAHSSVSGIPPRIQRFVEQSNGQMNVAPASVNRALASPGRPPGHSAKGRHRAALRTRFQLGANRGC